MSYILNSLPATQVLLLGLLPRGVANYNQPSILTQAMDRVNDELRCGVEVGVRARVRARVRVRVRARWHTCLQAGGRAVRWGGVRRGGRGAVRRGAPQPTPVRQAVSAWNHQARCH